MKENLSKIIKGLSGKFIGGFLLGSGLLVFTKEWAVAVLYVLFSGLFVLHNNKITALETRLSELEHK